MIKKTIAQESYNMKLLTTIRVMSSVLSENKTVVNLPEKKEGKRLLENKAI